MSTMGTTSNRLDCRPRVVGIYGLPSSGKSSLLARLQPRLPADLFKLFEGCEMVYRMIDGGRAAFAKATSEQKSLCRRRAIESIKQECAIGGFVGVVTGHLMLWNDSDCLERIDTAEDWLTYTHVLYLDSQPACIAKWSKDDKQRSRKDHPLESLSKWQTTEKTELRKICSTNGILFALLHTEDIDHCVEKARSLLDDFRIHTQELNQKKALERIDTFVGREGPFDVVIVLDADKTLTETDTGEEFWKRYCQEHGCELASNPLRSLFGGPLQYTYAAFRQATLLYESVDRGGLFNRYCRALAEEVHMYPSFQALLKKTQSLKDKEGSKVGVVVLTSGLGKVWDLNLKLAKQASVELGEQGSDSYNRIEVVAGSRIADGFVVTAEIKKAVVAQLQTRHGCYVYAFGDSPLDMGMLLEADEAIVVVGPESSRSRSMEEALEEAIAVNGLKASQLLFNTAAPRLDLARLALFDFDTFLQSFASQISVHDATDTAASKLLSRSTRDSSIAGLDLHDAHRNVGHYLAVEYLTRNNIIGLEVCDIPHVQGNTVHGHRLAHEDKTLIVSLMRGGDPMAHGIWKAFPTAAYCHAKRAAELPKDHLDMFRTVILADFVINSGRSISDFIAHIRSERPDMRMVVVAGVVQANAVRRRSILGGMIHKYGGFDVVALRLSQNKYTGSGGTDTGNRLFNTTYQK